MTKAASKLETTKGDIGLYVVAVSQREISTQDIPCVIRMKTILFEHLEWTFVGNVSRS